MAKTISIRIVRGKEIDEIARANYGISEEDFVELKIERDSPAKLVVTKLVGETPAEHWRNEIKKANLLDIKLS